jgi:hypothetical protein
MLPIWRQFIRRTRPYFFTNNIKFKFSKVIDVSSELNYKAVL